MAIYPTVFDVLEQSTPKYTATITDDAGLFLPAIALTTLTLTLYVIKADGTIAYINSRNHQSILNLNNGTVDANGLVTWLAQQADTTMVDASLPFERHIALFEWTWNSGSRAGKHETVLNVQNLNVVA